MARKETIQRESKENTNDQANVNHDKEEKSPAAKATQPVQAFLES